MCRWSLKQVWLYMHVLRLFDTSFHIVSIFILHVGTYGDGTGLTQEDDCTQCPGGYYCESPGQGSTTDECDPGFFCTIGKTSVHFVQSTFNYFSCTMSRLCPGPHFIKVAMIAISAGMATFFIISKSRGRITPVVRTAAIPAQVCYHSNCYETGPWSQE